jgi:hypothetical protein
VINLDVGQQIGELWVLGLRFGGLVDGGAQFLQSIREARTVRVRNGDAGRRDRPHIGDLIVLGAVGKGGAGCNEGKEEALHGWKMERNGTGGLLLAPGFWFRGGEQRHVVDFKRTARGAVEFGGGFEPDPGDLLGGLALVIRGLHGAERVVAA